MTNSLPVRNSQFKMKPDSENDIVLVFDCETDGLYDQVTVIHCVVIYDIHRKQTFSYGPDCSDDAIAHLATADILIGHNVIFYDIPVLQKFYPSFQPKARLVDTLICTLEDLDQAYEDDLDQEQYQDQESSPAQQALAAPQPQPQPGAPGAINV